MTVNSQGVCPEQYTNTHGICPSDDPIARCTDAPICYGCDTMRPTTGETCMTIALRPMSIGELLDRTFHLYRNNFPLFAGIAIVAAIAAVAAPLVLLPLGIAVPLPGVRLDPRTIPQTLAAYFVVFFLFYTIGSALAGGATVYAVSKVHLGETLSFGEAYSKVFPLLGRIVGIALLIILWVVGISFLVALLGGLALGVLIFVFRSGGGARPDFATTALTAIAVVALVLVIYFFVFRIYCKYSLAVPACVLENTTANESLKRSAFLARGSLWRIFLIYLLMGIIGAILSFCLQLPANLLARSAPQLALICYLLATFLAYTFAFPISTIAVSLVYYDQRVRKEAFDLQLLMHSMAQPGQATAATPIG